MLLFQRVQERQELVSAYHHLPRLEQRTTISDHHTVLGLSLSGWQGYKLRDHIRIGPAAKQLLRLFLIHQRVSFHKRQPFHDVEIFIHAESLLGERPVEVPELVLNVLLLPFLHHPGSGETIPAHPTQALRFVYNVHMAMMDM